MVPGISLISSLFNRFVLGLLFLASAWWNCSTATAQENRSVVDVPKTSGLRGVKVINSRCPKARPIEPREIGLDFQWKRFAQSRVYKIGEPIVAPPLDYSVEGTNALQEHQYDR